MSEITRILAEVNGGNARASELLPLVYEELRKLAAQRLAHEKPGQTLQATALVHEAYLRLLDSERGQDWNGRPRVQCEFSAGHGSRNPKNQSAARSPGSVRAANSQARATAQ